MMMKRFANSALAMMLFMMACSLPATAAAVLCTQCGMDVDLNSKFSAKIVQGNTTHYFCDIGDLLSYLQAKDTESDGALVKDYISGEWVKARIAFYVRAAGKFSTPMGWGIAAFKEKGQASQFGMVMDFDEVVKALK